jgi:hypothetical protein
VIQQGGTAVAELKLIAFRFKITPNPFNSRLSPFEKTEY